MKALRIFYNKDGNVIWTSSLEGSGVFPQSVSDELKSHEDGTQCLEIDDMDIINAFMQSDTNVIIDDKLIIGKSREPIMPPINYKTQFASAKTEAEQIAVMAKVLSLQ